MFIYWLLNKLYNWQVLLWQERLDRPCCERLKAIQNPPTMIAMVMLMTMVLLGRPDFSPFSSNSSSATRHEKKPIDGTPPASDDTSLVSSAGHSKKRNKTESNQARLIAQPTHTGKQVWTLVVRNIPLLKMSFSFCLVTGILNDGKIERSTWKSIQQIMNDSQKFTEALHNLSWREGLPDDIVAGVQPFFARNKEGVLGRTPLSMTSDSLERPSPTGKKLRT